VKVSNVDKNHGRKFTGRMVILPLFGLNVIKNQPCNYLNQIISNIL